MTDKRTFTPPSYKDIRRLRKSLFTPKIAGAKLREADSIDEIKGGRMEGGRGVMKRQAAEIDRLQKINKRLIRELTAAKVSLASIGNEAGREGSGIEDFLEIRAYARSRAAVALAAIAKAKAEG